MESIPAISSASGRSAKPLDARTRRPSSIFPQSVRNGTTQKFFRTPWTTCRTCNCTRPSLRSARATISCHSAPPTALRNGERGESAADCTSILSGNAQ
ncbi:hypothetical protein B0H17DRAFT_1060841 [Mycena rosella]|uniref:Uncharacterized protein n=1 Tax=Mycena rosella TaxID=1033263 RepID=A0AAD7DJP4_MYCRO|nr:hypothetical protein B0H17DRAFT_1060841 [Mycena rosella]